MTRGSLAVGALVMVTMRCGAGHITLRGKAASEEQRIQTGAATGLERKLHWRHTDDGTDDSFGTYYGATDDSFGTPDDSFGTDLGTTDDASSTYDDTTDDDESTDSSPSGDGGDTSTEPMPGWGELLEYLGCYKLKSGVPLFSPLASADMDPKMCFEHCAAEAAAYVALTGGHICGCGWEEETKPYTEKGEGDCPLPCSGDAEESCGGSTTFDFYRIVGETTGNFSASPTSAPSAAPTSTPTGSWMPLATTIAPSQSATDIPITGAPVGATLTPIAAPTPKPTPETAKPQTRPPSPVSTSTSAVLTPAPAAPETTPPGLDAEMGKLLELHNAARCMHGASPLSWSSEVASVAQSWAEHLTSSSMCGELEHSSDDQRNGYGENLYMCWGSSDGCYSSEDAMEGLYLEELTDGPVTEYGGHATQILWKSSAELGCAVESCSDGGSKTQVLVCNYNPPGNYNDRYEEEVEQPSKSAQSCGYP